MKKFIILTILISLLFLIIGCDEKEQVDLDAKFEEEAEQLRLQSLAVVIDYFNSVTQLTKFT